MRYVETQSIELAEDNAKRFAYSTMAAAAVQMGLFAYALSTYDPERIPNAFGYLTMWQLALLAMTCLVAAIKVANIYRNTKSSDKDPGKKRIHQLLALRDDPNNLRSLTFYVSIVASALFWGILAKDYIVALDYEKLGVSFAFHGLGFLLYLAYISYNRIDISHNTADCCAGKDKEDPGEEDYVDLAESKDESAGKSKQVSAWDKFMQFFHDHPYVRNGLFCATYLGFSVALAKGGVNSPLGQPYFYEVLDWNNHLSTALIFASIGLVAMLALTLACGWAQTKVRDWRDQAEREQYQTVDHTAGK